MNYIVFTDIRVDWETHNVVEGDNKLIDLIAMYGKPFPLKDSDDNEIVPPTERKYSLHTLAWFYTGGVSRYHIFTSKPFPNR